MSEDTTTLNEVEAEIINTFRLIESRRPKGELVFKADGYGVMWSAKLTTSQVSFLNYNLTNGIDTVFTIEAPKENNND